MSFHRVKVLYKKDLYWALGNFKLLGIMLLPVIFILVFSRLGEGELFAFNISFINAFIGIFSTSYLIIEEKNKGTLLSLLTTPLKSYELLLSKCLFNLSLCVCVSLFAVLVNQRLDILLSPLALLNLALFAGLTCFVGCIVGIFFKNEQEMSVLAPILMLFFIFGDALERASYSGGVFAYFPDYHITQIFKDQSLEFSQRVTHTMFNFSYFLVSLLTAAFYTQFYFSNNRERRYSHSLPLGIAAFGLALMASGLSGAREEFASHIDGKPTYLKVMSRHWKGRIDLPQNWSVKTLAQNQERQAHLLRPQQDKVESRQANFSLIVRTVKAAENSLLKRQQVVVKDPRRELISRERLSWVGGRPAQRLNYFTEVDWVVITESLCGDQILQLILEVPSSELSRLSELWNDFKTFEQSTFFTCDPSYGS